VLLYLFLALSSTEGECTFPESCCVVATKGPSSYGGEQMGKRKRAAGPAA